MNVVDWLKQLGLERYSQAFLDNEVDARSVPHLTAADLNDIGVTAVGHRRVLLEAIAALERGGAIPGAGITSTAPSGEAERRQLTVLFADLVDSTALSARLDPEDMREVMRAYQDACAGVITRFEGHVAKYLGDGVLAYFGWPRAHEDEAERAVRAGLGLADGVPKLATPVGTPLAARIGIATGLVVVGDLIGEGSAQEQAVVGDTPNLAARLQALAGPNQVVVAEATRRLLGAGFDLDDLGPQKVKGLARPVGAFVITGERAVSSRFEARAGPTLAPMVGRDQELALLLERWALAKAGEGQGVLLIGEAGIGKSRITRALLDAIAAEPHTRIRYQCSPYHRDSALWPVIQQLTRMTGIVDDDPAGVRLDKLEGLLARADLGIEVAPLFADLLGLDAAARYGPLDLTPQARRTRTLDALVAQLQGLAARQPTLVLLEDAHWIDPTSLELIELGLDRTAATRILLVLTSRPDHQPSLAAHPHITRLALNRIGRAGIEAIVDRLGGDRLPPTTIDAIIARTDGVPLYVEELTKAVLETGETSIPASLHDSLMARLDRIPDVKEVAQIAACIGREFEFSLIAEIAADSRAGLETALGKLTAAELIFRRGRPPDARYVFKHALVRDAAYQSLLRGRRATIHGRIAAVLEARDEARVAPELVAQHLTAAGDVDRAIGFWQMAGDRARERYANRESLVSYDRALELLANTASIGERQDRELELRVRRCRPLLVAEGYGAASVDANARRMVELARAIGDDRALWWALYEAGRYANNTCDFDRGAEYGREMVLLGRRLSDDRAIAAGIYSMASSKLVRGDLETARRELADGLELSLSPEEQIEVADHFQAAIGCLSAGSLTYWSLGYPVRARALLENALAQARQFDRPFPMGFALQRAAIHWQFEHAAEAALEATSAYLALHAEYPSEQWLPWVLIVRAWAQMTAGREDAAEADLAEAWRLWPQRRAELFGPYFRVVSAEVHLHRGRLERAQRLLDEASEVGRATGQHHWDAEGHRCRGALLLARSASQRGLVERELKAAIGVAQAQSARSLELRAACDLARLWAEDGERQKAYDLLAPVYAWFTEGFDTADLKQAKAVLGGLA